MDQTVACTRRQFSCPPEKSRCRSFSISSTCAPHGNLAITMTTSPQIFTKGLSDLYTGIFFYSYCAVLKEPLCCDSNHGRLHRGSHLLLLVRKGIAVPRPIQLARITFILPDAHTEGAQTSFLAFFYRTPSNDENTMQWLALYRN